MPSFFVRRNKPFAVFPNISEVILENGSTIKAEFACFDGKALTVIGDKVYVVRFGERATVVEVHDRA